ncbi:hypothetical protein PV10_06056 [Exophiala mesophila]|uniref:FAD dependent oxidoreductase domain-containing protein n=1 Tax=Exophiala mesophila TaxID=212818 RepID=A0A0D1ZC98_EXOME|nr:uncharacterized protein PV10_06056 [Exophiala mesophila]KIV91524.1 hypothetical protein PV10_06056 [Exophiala mesophila]
MPTSSSPPSPEKKSIVIVGGGIIGSTTAYYLTRHPQYDPTRHQITLLEATGIASGASGKAGGLLALWAYPSCLVPLSFRLHEELAAEHGGETRWGYRRVGVGSVDLVGRKLGRSSSGKKGKVSNGNGQGGDIRGIHRADVASDGNVEMKDSNDDAHVSLQKRSADSYARLRKMGLPDDLDWVHEDTVRGYEAMGGPEDTAQVHPYQFTTSMAELAAEKGVDIVLGSVTKIAADPSGGGGHRVTYTPKKDSKTPDSSSSSSEQTISATDVIVTAGPWTNTILPQAPISALRAHSVTIRPTRPVSAYCLFTSLQLPKNFHTGGHSSPSIVTPEIYARPNNELYACGEGDHLVKLPKSTADVEVDDSRCQDIVDYCASFSDEMRDGEVLVRQACYLPQVESAVVAGPLVGPTSMKGVWVAAGHTCWGIQNGPATGKIMSEFVFDGKCESAKVASLDPRKAMK